MVQFILKLRVCWLFLVNREQQNLQVTKCEICGARSVRRTSSTKRPGLAHGQRQHVTDYKCTSCGARCRCDMSWERE